MLKKKVTKFTGGKLRAKERKTLVCQDCDVVTVEVASDIVREKYFKTFNVEKL